MAITETETEAADNHAWLLHGFVEQLLSHEPSSVLDVGCGSGLLLRACRAAGARAIGLDQPGPRLDALRDEGFEVREGTAYEMPFEDRSVDWITLRHVPHHLEHPARALAEVLRVARTGLIVAEPWYAVSVPSQAAALAVDRWEKRQHRRRGMFHAECYDLGGLLGLLPADVEARFEVEVRQQLRLRERSLTEFEREAPELISDLPESHAERGALAELVVELGRHGFSWNGSLVVALRRRGARGDASSESSRERPD